jgi:hypothetical protein
MGEDFLASSKFTLANLSHLRTHDWCALLSLQEQQEVPKWWDAISHLDS